MENIKLSFALTRKDFLEVLKNEDKNEIDHLCSEIARTLVMMEVGFGFAPYDLNISEPDDAPIFQIYGCDKYTCDVIFKLLKEHA